MKNIKFIIILFFMFVIVTVIGFCTDTNVGKVRFRNQNFSIQQENANFTNTGVDISLTKSDVKNKNVNSNFSNLKISDKDINYKIQHTAIPANGVVNTKKSNIRNINTSSDVNNRGQYQNSNSAYRNISWNEWKSNFINRFLDDSLYIKSLDNYGLGTWFYYSFEVTRYGEIQNIKIFSFYLKPLDRLEIRNLIKSYAHKNITVFPENSNRQKAKIEAIVLLGESESKTKPSDFNDYERVKVKY